MRHALLSRFQGTLLAAALGDELGVYSRAGRDISSNGVRLSEQKTGLAETHLAGWHPGRVPDLALENSVSRQLPFSGRMAVGCARALVNAGGWHEATLAAIGDTTTSPSDDVERGQSRATGLLHDLIAAELAIATLPLTLFFHDSETNQQQRLLQTVKLWHGTPGAEAESLVMGYAIAQLLQDRLALETLLPQTIVYLKESTANPTKPLLELMDALGQAQILVQQGAGLHTAIERLWARDNQEGNGAIALAFYCFLSTPDDLRLSLLRAARCGEAAQMVCTLAGALSGAYHGMSGLPLIWQLDDTSCLSWGIAAIALRQLATQLFAAWSGVYAPAMPMDAVAIAAPGVIRPR